MTTTLSSEGHVALPESALTELGLRPGARLDCLVQEGKIVLSPKKKRPQKARLGKSRSTGLPVILAPPGAPQLTSEMVSHALSDFP